MLTESILYNSPEYTFWRWTFSSNTQESYMTQRNESYPKDSIIRRVNNINSHRSFQPSLCNDCGQRHVHTDNKCYPFVEKLETVIEDMYVYVLEDDIVYEEIFVNSEVKNFQSWLLTQTSGTMMMRKDFVRMYCDYYNLRRDPQYKIDEPIMVRIDQEVYLDLFPEPTLEKEEKLDDDSCIAQNGSENDIEDENDMINIKFINPSMAPLLLNDISIPLTPSSQRTSSSHPSPINSVSISPLRSESFIPRNSLLSPPNRRNPPTRGGSKSVSCKSRILPQKRSRDDRENDSDENSS